MSWYEDENGAKHYFVEAETPVTSVYVELPSRVEKGDWFITEREVVDTSLKQMAESLTELANETWPLYLEYKRQRSHRVWRKYSK